jgi:hypothetical protein
MPGYDGSGPRGEGALTGWGFGYCAAESRTAPETVGRFGPRGRGRGMQRGFRRGGCVHGRGGGVALNRPVEAMQRPPLAEETERLRVESQHLKERLDTIERRLAALGASGSKAQ